MRWIWLCLLATSAFSFSASAQNCAKGDCTNGEGTYVFPSGAKYIGAFKNGMMHGRGIFFYANGNQYNGNWVNQRRQGKGRMIFANGDQYFGFFNDNKIEGKGELTYANGGKYVGDWIDGRQAGQGIYYYPNGDRYEGAFQNDYPFGQGTYVYKDGSRYVGQWKNGKEHGQGTFYTAMGQPVNGQWVKGELQEDWSRFNASYDTLSVRNCNLSYCSGINGKYRYQDGTLYVGPFENGKPSGKAVVYFTNGDRYYGDWNANACNGIGKMHYASGRIKGGIWSNGELVSDLYESEGTPTNNVEVDRDDKVKIWAVIVGAAGYSHMPRLRYTDDDAYKIYAFLKSPEGGALPDDQLAVLIDENASKERILLALKSIFGRADENDVLLFYFSGHGVKGAFLPIDYDGASNRLYHEEIKNILKSSRAKHKLILADACHSGSLVSIKAPLQSVLEKYYKAFDDISGGTALMMSSRGEEYSLEDGTLRSGIFSHFLIKGLKGAADGNKNRIVTIQELYSYVHKEVRNYTGNVQTPTLTGSFNTDMPVSIIR